MHTDERPQAMPQIFIKSILSSSYKRLLEFRCKVENILL